MKKIVLLERARKKILFAYLITMLIFSMATMLSTKASASPTVEVFVDPPKVELLSSTFCEKNNTEFTIKVNITGVTGLYGYDIFLGYNNTILRSPSTSDRWVIGPGGVAPTGSGQVDVTDLSTANQIIVSVAFVEANGAPAFTGSGTLLWINFTLIYCPPSLTTPPDYNWANCTLDLSDTDTKIYNQLAIDMPIDTITDGEFAHGTKNIVSGPPTADFTWNPTYPEECDTVTLNDTSDPGPPGSEIVSWKWTVSNVTGGAHLTGLDSTSVTTMHCDAAGTVDVTLNVTNNAGKWDTNTTRINILSETDSPITTDDYDGLWHTTDFTITLNATDDCSGVAETYYRINDGPIQNVSVHGQPLITTESANNKLEYWSVDINDNEETPHHILTNITLDKTAPSGSIQINNDDAFTNSTSVTLNLSASDATSGVSQMRFSNDAITWTSWEPYTSSKAWSLTPGDGTKTVYYQINDNAGWQSETYPDSIFLDATKPSIGTISQEPQVPDEWEKVTITVNVTDGESGVYNVTLSYSINGGATWTDVPMNNTSGDTYVGEIPGLTVGTNVWYKITAYDNADNKAVDDKYGDYYVYQVVPEFPTWTSMLLILILLTATIAIYKRRPLKTPKH